MTTWYTSDQHFFHKNIITYCKRPFFDVDEMNVELIKRHNAKVKPADHVYMLGDCGFHSKKTVEILEQLNGVKHLIVGNHDSPRVKNWHGWESVDDMKTVQDGDHTIVLCHYPILSWDGMFRGVLHFHGHCHGTLRKEFLDDRKFCDVGVDCWDYEPVTVDEVLQRMFELGRWSIV